MIVNDLWIRPYVTMLQMMKFFANYVMAKISDPKDMVMVEVVCPHYWLVSLVNLLMIAYSKFKPKKSNIFFQQSKNKSFQSLYNCLKIFFRVDFLPAPRAGLSKNPKGCLRCGYSVYEAEKLIAAGRVSFLRMIRILIPMAIGMY